MDRITLFDIKDGTIVPTIHCHTNWYLKTIIEDYGDKIAGKIFAVFHYMADMSNENPYRNYDETHKLQFIIRNVCPELPLEINWDSELMLEGIELVRKMYETPSYRYYLASKKLIDKFSNELQTVGVYLDRENGNSGEIKKGFEMFEMLKEGAKKAYSDFEEEMNASKAKRFGGGGSASGRSKDLQ